MIASFTSIGTLCYARYMSFHVHVQIDILLGNTDNFDELLAAAVEERDVKGLKRARKSQSLFCFVLAFTS